MAVSLCTQSLNVRLGAAKSKVLAPQPRHLLPSSMPLASPVLPLFATNLHRRLYAQEKSNGSSSAPDQPQATPASEEDQSQSQSQAPSDDTKTGSMTEVASELKQMLKEKKEREQQDDNLLMGVSQEVREIEWPDLGKVLRTTGVVLAVIAGSTAALLSVNAVLAELSDRVFAGKGIQDFF